MWGDSEQENQVAVGSFLEAENGHRHVDSWGYVLTDVQACTENLSTQEGQLPSTQILQRERKSMKTQYIKTSGERIWVELLD